MASDVAAWFAGKVPAAWFVGPPEVANDGDEILVLDTLPAVDRAAGTSEESRAAARAARIDRFREETRDDRVRIAREAERQFRRKVARGATGGPGASGWSACTRRTGSRACGTRSSRWTKPEAKAPSTSKTEPTGPVATLWALWWRRANARTSRS